MTDRRTNANTIANANASESDPQLPTASITVLYVGDDPDYRDLVRTGFEGTGRLEGRTEPSPLEALRRLDGVDCVVGEDALPTGNGLELLEAVRERDPDLPFVLVSDDPRPETVGSLLSTPWTDHLRRDAENGTALLERRVCRLVDLRRRSTLARRALVAAEAARDGIALVAPDGTFEFVDRVYATTFGYDPAELVGRPWNAVYADAEAERLRSTALPTIEDGWQWTGGCVGRRKGGGDVTARTRIAGLEDGSLVFVVHETDHADDPD